MLTGNKLKLYNLQSLASYCVLLWAVSFDSSLCMNCSKLCEMWGTGKFFSETFWQAFTMPMLPAALLVLSGDAEQLISLFSVLVTGFNFLGFGIGLGG